MANLPFAEYGAPCDGKRDSLCNQLKRRWNGIVGNYNWIVSRPNLLAFHDPADTIGYIAGLYASVGRLEGMLSVLQFVPVKSPELQALEADIRANLDPISELSQDWYGRLQQEANKQTIGGRWEIEPPEEQDEYTLSALAFHGPQEFPEPEEE